MKYEYSPSGVCSRAILVEMDGDVLKDVEFIGGCNGNLKGISSLVKGMTYEELKEKLVPAEEGLYTLKDNMRLQGNFVPGSACESG